MRGARLLVTEPQQGNLLRVTPMQPMHGPGRV